MADILLDTNIIIDFFEETREFHQDALKLIDAAISADWELNITATTCKDSYYILTRLLGESTARNCLEAIFATMELLPVDNRVCYDGFYSNEPDFEDAIILSCAELNRMDYLISRDAKAFKNSKVPVLSPQEMLEKHRFINLPC